MSQEVMHTFVNKVTGDILNVPPPDPTSGIGVVTLNGVIVERVIYSDEGVGSATTEDGRMFTSKEWAQHILEQLRTGEWHKRSAS